MITTTKGIEYIYSPHAKAVTIYKWEKQTTKQNFQTKILTLFEPMRRTWYKCHN